MIPPKAATLLLAAALTVGCASSALVQSAGSGDRTVQAGGSETPPVASGESAPGREAPSTTASAAPAGSALTFSAEQSDRGRRVFRATCTECHFTSEFSDRSFKFKWRRRTAGDLFEHIITTMPEDAPGSLSNQQYIDVVAYILRMNGFEPGDGELPADVEALEALSLAPINNR